MRTSLLITLPWLLIVPIFSGQAAGQDARTFTSPDSYAEYPRWILTREGLAVLSFRASREDGLLLYLDSSGTSGHYLAVWLQGGRVAVKVEVGEDEPLEASFGEHLNDLNLHTLNIIHTNRVFRFFLNGTMEASLPYDLQLTFSTQSNVFVGGLPSSYEPDLTEVRAVGPLAGCVQGAEFANNSDFPIDLQPRQPIAENALRVGCVDECASGQAECNGGRCVTSWFVPGGFFCDCSSAGGVGEHCNEASSDYQIHVSGDAYSCYSLTYEPFTPHDNILVQLQSPVPVTGTILTGHSHDWTSRFFLYLKNSQLHYHLEIGNNTYTTETGVLLSQNQNYQVAIDQSSFEAIALNVHTVTSPNQQVDSQVLFLDGNQVRPVFSEVCVGGGALEVPLYSGVMESVFFGHFALAESRNFSYHDHEQVQRSDTISVSGTPKHPPLTFRKSGLSADRLSFQFRIKQDRGGVGMLMRSTNGTHRFTVSILQGGFGEIIIISADFLPCNGIFVSDDEWHLFVLERYQDNVTGGTGLRLTVDNNQSTVCVIDPEKLSQSLDTLAATSNLEMAPTTSGVVTEFDGDQIPFVGCFKDFEFTTGSETLRPNLEVAVREFDRFSSSGCSYCAGEEPGGGHCLHGGQCEAEGALQEKMCNCPPEFTGLRCQDRVGSTPTTDAPTPPLPGITTSLNTPSHAQATPTPGDGDTNKQEDELDYNALGQWVGVATAILIIIILLGILIVFLACLLRTHHIRRHGFYRTHENNPNVTIPQFSASLKTAHSRAFNPEQNRVTAIANGHTVHLDSADYLNGDKEFYI